MEEKYNILKPFLILDPLLLPLLVNICSLEDLPVVFSAIPTYLSAARLLKHVKDAAKQGYSFAEVATTIVEFWYTFNFYLY